VRVDEEMPEGELEEAEGAADDGGQDEDDAAQAADGIDDLDDLPVASLAGDVAALGIDDDLDDIPMDVSLESLAQEESLDEETA
jgi:hypothetical protein